MRSNFEPLGKYIRKVNNRNDNSEIETLKGINIHKEFMPSVANTIGSNMAKYRVVSQWQFAYNPMHVGRDEVLPISMSKDDTKVIVSPAYTVFEIEDHNQLNPEYLMMWCRRSEFDRNAWFTTDNSVRGGFSWESLCEMELPVPSIEKQREIVAEYNAVVDRIELNEQINQNLEETAKAIYRQWFEEFEFPISKEYAENVGKPELEGKPYKSCGGEMVYNKELDKEIPKGWEAKPVYDIAEFINGASFKSKEFSKRDFGLPIIKIEELKKGINEKTRFTEIKKRSKFRIFNGSLLYSWSGNPETSLNLFKWFGGEAWLNQHIFKIELIEEISRTFVVNTLKELKPTFIRLAKGKQTTGLGHITVKDLKELHIPYPDTVTLNEFYKLTFPLYELDSLLTKEGLTLNMLSELQCEKLTLT